MPHQAFLFKFTEKELLSSGKGFILQNMEKIVNFNDPPCC